MLCSWVKRLPRGMGGALILFAVAVFGCQGSAPPKQSEAAPKIVASGAARNQQVLNYLLDNKRVEWSVVEQSPELKLSPTGRLEGMPSQEEQEAFNKVVEGRPVPEAVRALVEKGMPVTATVEASRSTLSLNDAQEVIDKEDSSSRGSLFTGSVMSFGTWYRYGAVQVGVDEKGMVKGLRVDLAHFKG